MPGIGYQTRGNTSTTLTVGIPGNPIPTISVVSSVSAKGSESVAFADAGDENTKATLSGTVTTGDTVSLTAQDGSLANGAETVSHTVSAGETTTTIAAALATAVNADTALQAAGISALASGASITLAKYTYFTTSVGSGTETLSIASANRGAASFTVSGSVTAGNVLSITAHSATLPSGQETVNYTVVAGDTLLSIAQALSAAINADTVLQTTKITSGSSAKLQTTQSFQQSARLNGGSNLSAATATDGSSNSRTNSCATAINGGTGSALTFDLNGNTTSDGTNNYAWDAEDRMIKITYSGSGNYSSFVYDGLGRNTSIVETTSGSATSTRQFVWSAEKRPHEARNASGVLTNIFLSKGQLVGSNKYFYACDHLDSVRETTDISSTTVSERLYDPFGRAITFSETVPPDYGFAKYYIHPRSLLLSTVTRFYDCKLGRFMNRDSLGEVAGPNLFVYVDNEPMDFVDPVGQKKKKQKKECPPPAPPTPSYGPPNIPSGDPSKPTDDEKTPPHVDKGVQPPWISNPPQLPQVPPPVDEGWLNPDKGYPNFLDRPI